MKGISVLIGLLAGLSFITAFHAAVKYDGRDQYCIIMDADASGTITYETTQNKTETYSFTIPGLTSAGGQCMMVQNGSTFDSISLEFYPNNVSLPSAVGHPWNLTIVFKEDSKQTNNAYSVGSYTLFAEFYPEYFKNATLSSYTYVMDEKAENEWHGEKNIGFTCSKSGLSFSNDSSIVFEHLKLVAFGQFDSSNFTDTQGFELCKLDVRTSDLVPIVVGACLAGLVIAVLIAYLIGRARAKRQGYASV